MKSKQPAPGEGPPPTWDDILEVLDADQNGRVSWEEILSFIAQLEE